MLDFHNHLMPGVDDGAADLDESRAALAAMAADGITTIITTPHVSASFTRRAEFDAYLERMTISFESLRSLVAADFPELRVERGAEVMLDTPYPNLESQLLRLAATRFVLVEFPYMNIPPHSDVALSGLRSAGWTPVVAHPERYGNLDEHPGIVREWREAGAYLQLNSGSLIGAYGARAKRLAWSLLADGNVDYCCSDYHARGRCTIKAALRDMTRRGFEEQVAALKANATALLDDTSPEPVPPYSGKARAAWKNVFPWS